MISTFRHGVCVCLTALALALFLVVSPPGAAADDFECGLKAYMAGDYESAIAEWLPLAEQGDAMAEFGLGVMYDKGRGVPQDYVLAHMWYDLAASQGDEESLNSQKVMIENRDRIAGLMTPAQIAAAQALAAKCLASNYRDCGE